MIRTLVTHLVNNLEYKKKFDRFIVETWITTLNNHRKYLLDYFGHKIFHTQFVEDGLRYYWMFDYDPQTDRYWFAWSPDPIDLARIEKNGTYIRTVWIKSVSNSPLKRKNEFAMVEADIAFDWFRTNHQVVHLVLDGQKEVTDSKIKNVFKVKHAWKHR